MSQVTTEYEITRKVPESRAKMSLARLFEADSHVILIVDGQFEIGTCEKQSFASISLLGYTRAKMVERNKYFVKRLNDLPTARHIANALRTSDYFDSDEELVPYTKWCVHMPDTFFNFSFLFDRCTKRRWLHPDEDGNKKSKHVGVIIARSSFDLVLLRSQDGTKCDQFFNQFET